MRGTRLGPYRVESELGAGGMGNVHLAEVIEPVAGLEPGTRVALKIIHPHLLQTSGFFKRFLREAEIGKAVRHPNVVRTHDVDALGIGEAYHHFLVMEYVEGQTLRELLREMERVPEELCRHTAREVTKGLVAIHDAGVIHRDLKPENVLITPENVVKIMDLGVARLANEVFRLSQSGAFVGSVRYAAPEQFRMGGKDVDGRADLHSLGGLLYELACGKHPYRAADTAKTIHRVLEEKPRRLGEVNPQVSPYFEEVVHTLLQKDRRDRFSSAAELLVVLEAGELSAWWRGRAKAIRQETRRPLRRIRIQRETAVFGREREIAQLRNLYERARGGEGRAVLIEGEAGIGKTRLVDEVVARLLADGEDLNFLFGSYPPGGAATAAGAWSTAYREHFGEDGCADCLKETPVLVPAFDALLRGEPPPKGEEPLTKDSIHTVFVHATRALASERPTVVLIEDLHFAPREGRALLAALALAVPEHRVLLVGTSRPGLPDSWVSSLERLDHTTRIELERLGPKDLALLLRDAFLSERLAQDLCLTIGEKSDGNPFFVFEIIRGLREGQYITKSEDGSWVTTKVIRDLRIPSSILDLIQARISELDDDERELLDVAACCGFEFDPLLVGKALDLPEIPLLRRLAHLERPHRIVRSAGRRFVFDHHQVQEALYAGLPELLREQYHAALATALEAREVGGEKDPEDLPGGLTVDLAEHLFRGGRSERALRYLDVALDHLEAGYLNDQAIALADRALADGIELPDDRRAKLLLRRAERLDLLGRRDEQSASLVEARALADRIGDLALRTAVRRSHGALLGQLARHEEARAEMEDARALARQDDDRLEEANIIGGMAVLSWGQGRNEEALGHLEEHLAIALEVGDLLSEARARGNMGLILSATGRFDEALEQNDRCLAISCELGNRRIEGTVTGNQGLVFWRMGRHEEARDHHARSIEIAREIGNRQGEALATGNQGLVLWSLGRYDEARDHHERNLEVSREVGDRRSEGIANENLGMVAQMQGRREEARNRFETFLAIAREVGDRLLQGRAFGNLGWLSRTLGRYAEAAELYDQHLAIAQETGDRRGEAVAFRIRGELRLLLGLLVDAESDVRTSLDHCRELGAREHEAHAILALGGVDELRGDLESAIAHMEEADGLFREIGNRNGAASTILGLGWLRMARGENEAAREAFDEAARTAAELDLPGATVVPLAYAAVLGGDVDAALEAYAACEGLLRHADKVDARFLHFRATGDPAHLEEAHRLLRFLIDHAPEACRRTMVENIPLHRDILAAWREHGGETASPHEKERR